MNKPMGAIAADYGPEEAAMRAYCEAGERRALALGNRGPIRFTEDGELHPEIVEAYGRHGFYVFEGVLQADELADIEADFRDIQSRLPTEQGSEVDARGRPALGLGHGGGRAHRRAISFDADSGASSKPRLSAEGGSKPNVTGSLR